MKSKFFRHLKCISPEDDSDAQETMQKTELSQDELQQINVVSRFSKFNLVTLASAQKQHYKLSEDTCVPNNFHLTPDILRKQLSNLKKTAKQSMDRDMSNDHNTECDELESPQAVVTKGNDISEIPIAEALPQSNRDTYSVMWQEVDAILASCSHFLNNDEHTDLSGLDSTHGLDGC